jgi:nucleotide-binding universal stress UspA family protein
LAREAAAAELLVVGATGRGRIAGTLLGSTVTNVIHLAAGPVVVVRASEPVDQPANQIAPESIGQVVIGVDGSDLAQRAVRFAFAEAALHGVGLLAVHAWIKPPHPSLPAFMATGWLDWSFLEHHAADVLAESVAAVQPDFPEVPVIERVVNDQPGAALVTASARARLLVVGSRGRGGLAGLVLGSVSHGVLHQAHCPVAVVRPDSDTDQRECNNDLTGEQTASTTNEPRSRDPQ